MSTPLPIRSDSRTRTALPPPAARLARLTAGLLWLALCALAAFWITILGRGMERPVGETARVLSTHPAAATPAPLTAAALETHARLLVGSEIVEGSAGPAESGGIRALGIVTDNRGRGTALLSVNGEPARAYRPGDNVAGRTLRAVRVDTIELERDGQIETLHPPARPSLPLTAAKPAPGARQGTASPP